MSKSSASSRHARDIFEVDLGDVQSLKHNEVHISDLLKQKNLNKGDVVVDDTTIADDALKYKLVMVGRKVTEEEQQSDRYLEAVLDDAQHGISSEVFHESGERHSEAVVKNEGVAKYYLRNSYMAIGMLLGVYGLVNLQI